MSKASQAEYKSELDQAMEEVDEWGDDESPETLSEAEQLAHAAERPKRRKDGEHRGSDVKRPKPLSPRQVLFTQGVIQGKSLRQAYRDAYGNDTGSDASISASANKLMKDPRIKHVLEEAWEEIIVLADTKEEAELLMYDRDNPMGDGYSGDMTVHDLEEVTEVSND